MNENSSFFVKFQKYLGKYVKISKFREFLKLKSPDML
jgi:hypothetical protein